MNGFRKTGTSVSLDPRIAGMYRSMELKKEILADQEKVRAQAIEQRERMAALREQLKLIDPLGWEAWWDGPNMPDYMPHKDRADLIEQRIASLEFKSVETRLDQIEEKLLRVEVELTGEAYTTARDELLNEFYELGDKLAVYETPVQ